MNLFKNTFVILLFFCSFLTNAQEKILNFDVTIQIEKSGNILVNEKITIKAEGNIFKHGLLRTLPLTRKDQNGQFIDVKYTINYIKKDGVTDNYTNKEEDNFWKIYIGDKDNYLENKSYKYEISYSTPYQIGYFDNYDELYWNVTGNGWDIPIDNASCKLYLPSNNRFLNEKCYVGVQGSGDTNCIGTFNEQKTILNFNTKSLNAHEGLTIAASFEKGIIDPPTQIDKAKSFYNLIKLNLWSALLAIGAFLFYFFDWRKNGKDPSQKTVIPEFRPPFSWSPAIVGYVFHKEIKSKIYLSSLVNCAIKGALKILSINVEGSTGYEIEIKNNPTTKLSIDEEALFKPLSKSKNIKVDDQNHKLFEKAYSGWLSVVTGEINLEDYYSNNTRKKGINFLIFVIIGLSYIVLTNSTRTISIGFYLTAIAILIGLAYWYSLKVENTAAIILRFLVTFFGGFLAVGSFFMTLFFLNMVQLIVLGVIFIIYLVSSYNLGAYTATGAEALRQLTGFKLFLETTEKNRINLLNPPEFTPQLFEELLPYAMALDVDVAWGESFKNILDLAKYDPAWGAFDDDFYKRPMFLSNFNDRVDSSRVDPNSSRSSSSSSSGSSGDWSSGSSDSGSSGGGGGGGGGGGW